MVILWGLITLEEEGCVVSEWFPVSILNDCVCETSIFVIPRRVIFVGWLPLKLRETRSSEMLGANDPKTASPPRRHESSALVCKLACLRKYTEQQQLLLFFGRLLEFIMSYCSSKSFWGKIWNISFRLFFNGLVLLVVAVVQQT